MPDPCVLCRLDDIAVGASKGFAAEPTAHYADILVVRTADGVYAYRNACPHTGAPMEWQTDQFLDYSGKHIVCSLHGALFRIEDGYCFAGPCRGRSLRKIPLAIHNDRLVALNDIRRHHD